MVIRHGGQRVLPFVLWPCYPCWFEYLDALPGRYALPDLGRRGRRLCDRHQARFDEGACILCGRRLAWLTLASTPEIGLCRPCFVARRGEEAAEIVEAMLECDGLGLMV